MRLEALSVSNVRCLASAEYLPAAGINLIWGPNGSGKTSLLEAASVIALGKSFLTNRTADLVRFGASGMSVRADTVDRSGSVRVVSVRKERSETRITLDGQPVLASSVLARNLPIMVFNSKAVDLLTESPTNRRALIDRTMFHVEPNYGEVWKRYRQVLRQRNELVRAERRTEAKYWDEQLAALANSIDAGRRRVVDIINERLRADAHLPGITELAFEYNSGWNEATSLLEQLGGSWHRDCQVGYTTLGSHRADLSLKAHGRSIARRLSRGQGKFVVCTVLVALAEFIARNTGSPPVILVDDLAAELDDMIRARAVDMIFGLKTQCLFTAIKPDDLPQVRERAESMFHVEHQPRLN